MLHMRRANVAFFLLLTFSIISSGCAQNDDEVANSSGEDSSTLQVSSDDTSVRPDSGSDVSSDTVADSSSEVDTSSHVDTSAHVDTVLSSDTGTGVDSGTGDLVATDSVDSGTTFDTATATAVAADTSSTTGEDSDTSATDSESASDTAFSGNCFTKDVDLTGPKHPGACSRIEYYTNDKTGEEELSGTIWTWQYNEQGLPTSWTSNSTDMNIWDSFYEYDELNRLIKSYELDKAGPWEDEVETFVYSSSGKDYVMTFEQRAGWFKELKVSANNSCQIIVEQYGEGYSPSDYSKAYKVLYTYNDQQQLVLKEQFEGFDGEGELMFATSYVYDSNGNLIHEEKKDSSEQPVECVKYSDYDATGNYWTMEQHVECVDDESKFVYTYRYDEHGNLLEEWYDYAPLETWGDKHFAYTYDCWQ